MALQDDAILQWLVSVRRDFHMFPELSQREVRTTEKIKELLQGMGVEVRELEGMTGLVGLIRGSDHGKTIALRADMDALPIQELNDVPYRSKEDGIMHACGHDVHTTVMLGVAKHLQESGVAATLKGNVKFLFQPAEEKGLGAKGMIARGVLENPRVDRVLACHVSPHLDAGKIGIYRTQGFASADRFHLAIKGKGTHGARPNEGVDPIVAGSYFVTAVQSIVSRNISPTDGGVISVGRFNAGRVGNVIPETAELEGTIRALRNEVREQVMGRLKEVVEGLERTFEVSCDLRFGEGVPACVNDENTSTFLHDVSARVLGPENVVYLQPVMGGEDFALFAMERPGAIIRLGCRNEEKGFTYPFHSPRFDVDEDALLVGVRVFTEAVRRYLA